MHKKSATIYIFCFFLLVSLLIWLLGSVPFLQPVSSVATFFTAPIQKGVFSLFYPKNDSEAIQQVKKENQNLLKQLVNQKKLIAEDNALRDQFKTNRPSNVTLLPADVIGAPGIVPGVSGPESLILNVGAKQGVSRGQAVVVKDVLIGRIEKVSYLVSTVALLQTLPTPFTAKTMETNAIGLVYKTDSGGLLFGNVVLSDTLKKGDFIITKGDVDIDKRGFPPDLLVGKIISIDKKPSDLFQTAKIIPLVDVSKITTVFVVSY